MLFWVTQMNYHQSFPGMFYDEDSPWPNLRLLLALSSAIAWPWPSMSVLSLLRLSKNPGKSVYQESPSHAIWSSSSPSTSTHSTLPCLSPWPALSKDPLRSVRLESPYPSYLPLVIFHPLMPLTTNPTCPCCIQSWVWSCSRADPIAMVKYCFKKSVRITFSFNTWIGLTC